MYRDKTESLRDSEGESKSITGNRKTLLGCNRSKIQRKVTGKRIVVEFTWQGKEWPDSQHAWRSLAQGTLSASKNSTRMAWNQYQKLRVSAQDN